MVRHLFSIALLVFASAAFGKDEGLVGKWSVRSDGQTVMMIEIAEEKGKLAATMFTPQKGYINQSHAAVDMSGPVKVTKIEEIRRESNSVEFASASDPADINVLTLVEPELMTFGYKSAPSLEPVFFRLRAQAKKSR